MKSQIGCADPRPLCREMRALRVASLVLRLQPARRDTVAHDDHWTKTLSDALAQTKPLDDLPPGAFRVAHVNVTSSPSAIIVLLA